MTLFNSCALPVAATVGVSGPVQLVSEVSTAIDTTADFDSFYNAHYGRLAGALRLVCGDDGIAEDLAQESFVKAYTHWSSVRAHPNPEGWLFVTGFNLAKRRWRTVAKRGYTTLETGSMPVVGSPDASRIELEAAIERLPMKQRAAVVTRYVLGYSGDEAAELLGMSSGALRVTLHRALTTLRLDPSCESVDS